MPCGEVKWAPSHGQVLLSHVHLDVLHTLLVVSSLAVVVHDLLRLHVDDDQAPVLRWSAVVDGDEDERVDEDVFFGPRPDTLNAFHVEFSVENDLNKKILFLFLHSL